MDLPVIIRIAVISICSVLICSQVSSTPKNPEPFRADKAEWYYDEELKYYLDISGKSEKELTDADKEIIWDYSCNHCAMFLTWAIMRGYCGDIHLKEEPGAVESVKNREMTGTAFFIKYCDCKLWREDFSDNILPFVDAYYYSRYLDEYSRVVQQKLNKGPWGISFSWEDYEVIEKILDKAYRHWKFLEKPVIVIGKKKDGIVKMEDSMSIRDYHPASDFPCGYPSF